MRNGPRNQSGNLHVEVPVIGPDGIPTGNVTVQDFDVLVCSHCNRGVVLNKERKRARGWCRRCEGYVCDFAVCMSECNPIIQGVELALKYAGKPFGDQPFLARGKRGEVLFDKRLSDRERVF